MGEWSYYIPTVLGIVCRYVDTHCVKKLGNISWHSIIRFAPIYVGASMTKCSAYLLHFLSAQLELQMQVFFPLWTKCTLSFHMRTVVLRACNTLHWAGEGTGDNAIAIDLSSPALLTWIGDFWRQQTDSTDQSRRDWYSMGSRAVEGYSSMWKYYCLHFADCGRTKWRSPTQYLIPVSIFQSSISIRSYRLVLIPRYGWLKIVKYLYSVIRFISIVFWNCFWPHYPM